MTRVPLFAVVLVSVLSACGPARFSRVLAPAARPRPPSASIDQLHLQWSNVFLVRSGGAAVLVDSGSPGDWAALDGALRAAGVAPNTLRAAVMTHGHADHAGLAARLAQSGVPVLLGAGDVPMAARGRNGRMRATAPFASLLRPLFDFSYRPFAPTVVVERTTTLDAYGLPGVRVEPLAGHTAGSLVVWVTPRDVIVGDEMLGGLVFGGDVEEHLYEAEPMRNHCNVQRLLDAGVERFYLGHGGPVGRGAVLGWRREWLGEVQACRDGWIETPR